jgi:hypothetical protein
VGRTTAVLKEAIIILSKAAKETGLNNQSAKKLKTWKSNSRILKVHGQEFERANSNIFDRP